MPISGTSSGLAAGDGLFVALDRPPLPGWTSGPRDPGSESGVHALRLRVKVRGAVQGVGFRPFVYRLATGMGLSGWVNNGPEGVCVEVEGPQGDLRAFLLRLQAERPPCSSIHGLEPAFLDAVGYTTFEIRPSDPVGEKTVLVMPDIAPCPDCIREIFSPADRRFRYPFTNCTNCGPRFTIVQAIPYDRPNTTMRGFRMCPRCQGEYEDPRDRRFHAQPNACPDCGPHLEVWNPAGGVLALRDEALTRAGEALRAGGILALKGVGGFHLMVDARLEEGVRRLRQRKAREEKPLAVMFPSAASVREACEVSDLEERLLCSPERPIVLLRKRADRGTTPTPSACASIAPSVAPGNPLLGAMLPSSPAHALLMADLKFPVVATSGNLSDEPICTDEHDALKRLGKVADLFLVHDRPIARNADDSVLRVVMDRELVIRRARGFAPLPVPLPGAGLPWPVLAVGAQQKNTVAVAVDGKAFLSQHVGDLDTPQSLDAFRSVIEGFRSLYDLHPATVACDLHPDYASTRHAFGLGLPLVGVQHHFAHVLSCMAENELDGPVLGVSWDGTGYGTDGTVWGGEFLRVEGSGFERVGHFRGFPLPGGDRAVREPRRAALGLLYALFGDGLFAGAGPAAGWVREAFSPGELAILRTTLNQGLHAPITSSVGRLFDAVSALSGFSGPVSFEGQAAMDLEHRMDGLLTDDTYPFRVSTHGMEVPCTVPPKHSGPDASPGITVDWGLLVEALLVDLDARVPAGLISARFHNTLVETIVTVARIASEPAVVLTGGCFQNRYLAERAVHRLRLSGFHPYWHQRVPPNDGGIALGQLVAAVRYPRRG